MQPICISFLSGQIKGAGNISSIAEIEQRKISTECSFSGAPALQLVAGKK